MDDLFGFCQAWAKNHGYAIAKSNSHPGKNIYIKCDRSGHFRGSIMNNSGCKTATTKINCPFHVKGSVPTSKKITSKLWTMEVLNGTHNHEPSDGASSHAAHKRLLPEQFEEIRKLSQANIKPAQILLQLCTSDNKTYATNKTISNALQKIHRNDLAGRKPIEALLCILKESNWIFDVKVNSSGAVLNLFFAHPGAIHLTRINHHIALLDST
jgi:malonate-semialdehyde dehydrogenase (acetylating)/methylmalonate-semialdehyde dehydrogenase